MSRIATAVRRQHFHDGPLKFMVDRLPTALRDRAALDPPSSIRRGAVQIGTRPHLLPGYLHVALQPGHPHAELRVHPSRMMLPRAAADEIVAIGVLDRLRPFEVSAAIGYWRRGLRRGGRLVVGVVDSAEVFDDDGTGPPESLWSRHPGASPGATSSLQVARDHPGFARFNRRLLEHLLTCNGFEVAAPDDFALPAVPEDIVDSADIVMIGRAR